MSERRVEIDLKEYEELRKAKKMLSSGKVLVNKAHTGPGLGVYQVTEYYTNDEVSAELAKEIDRLKGDLKMQENIISNTTRRSNLYKEMFEKTKHMTWWEFRKWKKELSDYLNKNQ